MGLDTYLRFLIALVLVVAMIGALAWVVRRFGWASRFVAPAGKKRLSVLEVLPLDGKRRLVPATTPALPLPEMTAIDRTSTDYRVMALTTGPHLVAYYREQMRREGVIDSEVLKTLAGGVWVKVAGLVITRNGMELLWRRDSANAFSA